MADKDNAVAKAKQFAIQQWDEIAQRQVRRGNYIRGFGAWTLKQAAKASSESWLGLGFDVASLGTGAIVSGGLKAVAATRAVTGARIAVNSERLLQEAITAKRVIAAGQGAQRAVSVGQGAVLLPEVSKVTRAIAAAGKGLNSAEAFAKAWGARNSVLGVSRRVAKWVKQGVSTENAARKAATAAAKSTPPRPVAPPKQIGRPASAPPKLKTRATVPSQPKKAAASRPGFGMKLTQPKMTIPIKRVGLSAGQLRGPSMRPSGPSLGSMRLQPPTFRRR
jgi:hypothetical protein